MHGRRRALSLLFLAVAGCHDLDAIPRVGEIDASVMDASSDASIVDGSEPLADGAPSDGAVDMGPPPLLPLWGAQFELPFPVRSAIPHAGGVLAVGADSGGRSEEATRQGVVAHFGDEVVEAFAVGGDQNDQYFAVTADGEDALAVGLIKEPTFGGDDLLVTRFTDGVAVQSAHVGDSANEIAFDAIVVDGDLVTAGRCAALPCVVRLDSVLGDPAVAFSVDVGADGAFLGLRQVGGLIVAVGETTGEDPRRATIAAFDAGTDALVWVRSIRFAGADNHARFLDVGSSGADIVAVGNRGSVGVRAVFSTDGELRSVESVGPQTALFQVGTMDGREHYVGRNEGVLALGRRTGTSLAFDRLPFDEPNMGGRAAYFGSEPFLVAVNGDAIYLAPLNEMGRASCATAERTQPFTPLNQGDDYEVSASGTRSGGEELAISTFSLSVADEAAEPLGRACPSSP